MVNVASPKGLARGYLALDCNSFQSQDIIAIMRYSYLYAFRVKQEVDQLYAAGLSFSRRR